MKKTLCLGLAGNVYEKVFEINHALFCIGNRLPYSHKQPLCVTSPFYPPSFISAKTKKTRLLDYDRSLAP